MDGLVHISQISNDNVEKVKDVLKVGEKVEARIVKIDGEERKIGLSIKAVNMSDEEFQALVDTFEEHPASSTDEEGSHDIGK